MSLTATLPISEPPLYLDVQLVDFGEESSNSVVSPAIVQEHELRPPRRQKRRHVLLVKLVNYPQISARNRFESRGWVYRGWRAGGYVGVWYALGRVL